MRVTVSTMLPGLRVLPSGAPPPGESTLVEHKKEGRIHNKIKTCTSTKTPALPKDYKRFVEGTGFSMMCFEKIYLCRVVNTLLTRKINEKSNPKMEGKICFRILPKR